MKMKIIITILCTAWLSLFGIAIYSVTQKFSFYVAPDVKSKSKTVEVSDLSEFAYEKANKIETPEFLELKGVVNRYSERLDDNVVYVINDELDAELHESVEKLDKTAKNSNLKALVDKLTKSNKKVEKLEKNIINDELTAETETINIDGVERIINNEVEVNMNFCHPFYTVTCFKDGKKLGPWKYKKFRILDNGSVALEEVAMIDLNKQSPPEYQLLVGVTGCEAEFGCDD